MPSSRRRRWIDARLTTSNRDRTRRDRDPRDGAARQVKLCREARQIRETRRKTNAGHRVECRTVPDDDLMRRQTTTFRDLVEIRSGLPSITSGNFDLRNGRLVRS